MKGIFIVFWGLLAFFIIVIGEIFIPSMNNIFSGSILFLLPIIIFSLLGLALIVLALKEKLDNGLKKFLILSGSSALGFFVSVLFYNLFYAWSLVVYQNLVLRYLMQILDTGFFFISLFVCPIGFLIGVTVSIDILIRRRSVRG